MDDADVTKLVIEFSVETFLLSSLRAPKSSRNVDKNYLPRHSPRLRNYLFHGHAHHSNDVGNLDINPWY